VTPKKTRKLFIKLSRDATLKRGKLLKEIITNTTAHGN